MAALIEATLFALPFLLYWGWLRLGGRALSPSNATLSLVAVGVACGIAGLAWYGLGRSIERGERYVPAVLRDGAVR